MLWQLYLKKGTAYVPTVAETEAGFYIDIEPVRVVMAADSEALQIAIKEALTMRNPVTRTPTRAAFPKPVVLKYAKASSWSAFEKDAQYWKIIEKDGNYEIRPGRRRAGKGWEDDPERVEILRPGTALETVANRLASLVRIALENAV